MAITDRRQGKNRPVAPSMGEGLRDKSEFRPPTRIIPTVRGDGGTNLDSCNPHLNSSRGPRVPSIIPFDLGQTTHDMHYTQCVNVIPELASRFRSPTAGMGRGSREKSN